MVTHKASEFEAKESHSVNTDNSNSQLGFENSKEFTSTVAWAGIEPAT